MNTNTTTKASPKKMDSKNGGTTGTLTGPANDDGLTCYNCGQVGHISCNCPNRNLMKKLLEQALVGKDTPKAKSGRPPKTGNGEVHQLVEKRVGGLQKKRRLSRRWTVRWRGSWRVSQTQTLKQEKANEVSSCGCTSHKNTMMYSIVKQKGWQIGAR